MALLNYSTRIEPHQTVSEIIAILVRHGARQTTQNYDDTGAVVALTWSTEGAYGTVSYAMPVNYEAVYQILTEERRIHKGNDAKRMHQAKRVAWRILKDWIEAQAALLQTGMVDFEQVFLPYMLSQDGDNTLYEVLADKGFRSMDTMESGGIGRREAIPLRSPSVN